MDLSKDDFLSIRNIIKKHSGIWLTDSRMNFIKPRLIQRLKAVNMETIRDYFFYLKYDPNRENEINELIDAVTVNETYFFREQDQLDDFNTQVIPAIIKQKQRGIPIRLWSAGCSTGTEPYTLAMILLEHDPGFCSSDFNILGSDINHSVLNAAREGIYDDYSIRHIPRLYLLKYFDKTDQGYHIKTQIKETVKFARINLMDTFSTARIKDMDCIFCRNVLIYFDDEDKLKCVEYLYRSLSKGGYLFLGHADNICRIFDLFEVVRLKKTIAYRKSM